MKALSLRQPWAAAVLRLGKRIENRRWNTTFRGEFLIHAAKGMTSGEYESAVDFCEDVLGLVRCYETDDALDGENDGRALPRGGIVGMARLVDVVPPRPEFMSEGVEKHYPTGVEWRWHMREQFGFVLADVRPLPFVPCRGSLGFFEVPADVLAKLGRSAA